MAVRGDSRWQLWQLSSSCTEVNSQNSGANGWSAVQLKSGGSNQTHSNMVFGQTNQPKFIQLKHKGHLDLFQLSRSLARCRIGVSSVAFGLWIVQVCCVPWCFWIVAAFAWLGILEMQLTNYSTRHISHHVSLHIQWYDLCIWLYMVIYIYMWIHRLE